MRLIFSLIAFAISWLVLLFVVGHVSHANPINGGVNQPTFPPAGLTLLATVPAQSGTRNSITVQNQDDEQIELWRDNTCVTANPTAIILAPAGSEDAQGSAWSSSTFKGCVRIYGEAGAAVGIWQD